MTSQDNQQYLTVDLFNAKMDAFMRTNELSFIELKNEIRLNASDIAHLQTSVYWGFAVIAIVVALIGLVVALAPTFLASTKEKDYNKKNYTTAEQVQEIVDKAIARAFSSVNK